MRTLTLVSMLCLAPVFLVACGSGSGGLPSCQGAGEADSACNTCLMNNCSVAAASYDSDCGAYAACLAKCKCSDFSCLEDCNGSASAQCQAAMTAASQCFVSSCRSECSPPF